MGRLTLSHLTFTGTNTIPASVDFSPHVTVIHGPSDTGKSFIVDAIDFVLGAKELKEIPEREGYSRVLLGLELPTGERVTLARSVEGGGISLYRADIRVEPSTPPDETLSAKHSAANTKNVSRFLLDQVGLDEKQVRKNARNETHMLSFRDLTRLCLIGETEMQAEEAPGLSGNPVNKTKEVSVLKLLLAGEDDSALTAVPSAQEQKRLRGARQEVVERMLSQLESQLQDVAEPAELKTQLGKLNRTIDKHSTMIGSLTEQRGQLLRQHNELQSADSAQRSEYSDAAALRQRFTLLQKQYESDLARLEMIAEAGNLLGYFRSGTCVFCGAEPASQHLNLDCEGDVTSFGLSVDSETRKTQGLLDDLRVTMESLDVRAEVLRASISSIHRDVLALQKSIGKVDADMAPEKGNLRDLLAKRSEIEKHLGLYEQVKTFEDMIRRIADETEAEVATAVAGLSLTAVREFSAEISKRLAEWDYPSAASVRYDRNELDIIAGDQRRSAHGKGVRAVLHAAFTLALAQYCFDRDLPHPGFVILDSPLVTYRPPDQSTETDDEPPEGVVRAFYRDIEDNFDGQVIVMENTDPLDPLGSDALDIRFTKRVDIGRYGYMPAAGDERAVDALTIEG
ncbi:AAA family ATPase [Microbacterium rhizomatis]|uniref:AAA family ATPase n=1 Tax=Microbacterium rhizomatis TaxID=1631477 RepID=A0A5J5J6W4_9MICO|nr:AAA family ATPase [Microbacterium rhizomatis]KAA9110725.1 AAA family ATPase [Microbacterium rhizomatis]